MSSYNPAHFLAHHRHSITDEKLYGFDMVFPTKSHIEICLPMNLYWNVGPLKGIYVFFLRLD
jgi:hypothetical protein